MINRGKIRVAARNNQSIPAGVALDKFGKPTTDAKKALAGVQLPIAGFRGSGLAWMVDILSGVLTGGNHAGRVKDPFDDFSGPQNIGHLFITFKANLFSLIMLLYSCSLFNKNNPNTFTNKLYINSILYY